MGAYATSVLASSGLVSYWRLGESSGTSVADAKGSNTGTSNGPTLGAPSLVPAETGTAYSFDGVNDSVDFGNPANLQLSTSTIRLWVKTTASGFISILAKPGAYYLWMSDGTLGIFNYGTSGNIFSSAVINDGLPHMIELKYVSAGVNGSRLLVDGVAVGTFTMTVTAQTSAITLGNADTFYAGIVDEMAIWNSIVPDATSVTDYALGRTSAETGPAPGLMLPV